MVDLLRKVQDIHHICFLHLYCLVYDETAPLVLFLFVLALIFSYELYHQVEVIAKDNGK